MIRRVRERIENLLAKNVSNSLSNVDRELESLEDIIINTDDKKTLAALYEARNHVAAAISILQDSLKEE